MNRVVLLCWVLGLFTMAGRGELVVVPAEPPVQEVSLDGTWRFQPGPAVAGRALDAEAQRLDGVATNWFPLAVPQFLNRYAWWLDISDKFVAADRARLAALPFPAETTQAGWYRRDLLLPAASGAAPEVFVQFEGVAMVSRVFCNGQPVGGHVGMFGSFECRLTPHLRWGRTNTLLVYAERGATVKDADSVLGVAVTVPVTRGMLASLNHGMFGGFGRGANARFLGIWQPVTLKVSRPGGRIVDVFFDPALDGHRLEVTLDALGSPWSGEVVSRVTDRASGTVLCEDTLRATNAVLVGTRTGLAPRWWTPDTPHLYDLVVEWRAPDGSVRDRWTHRVGYRTVSVRGVQLLLNGRPYWTRGAGMPVYGYKPNDTATARGFLRRMHEGHQMVTRSGCNPWNALWYSVADEEGVGVAAEGVRPWALMTKAPPPEPALLEHWKQEQLEVVRRYRNHPSILFHCISNEGLQGDVTNPQKIALFRDIIQSVRALDPSRPVCQTSGDEDVAGNADLEDVHSYWGWYEPSSYVLDYDRPRRGLEAGKGRAFLNKECAVPYQDTDTGGVHPAYIKRYSAHPWVGERGAEGADPAFFAEHIRAETKLKTEKLRRQRKEQPTAGMILFANTTWIQDVLTAPPDQWKPFPVWDAAREALQPVLPGWTTAQEVFFEGETVRTRGFLVNDDAHFRDLSGLTVTAELLDRSGTVRAATKQSVAALAYFDSVEWPMTLTLPASDAAQAGPVPMLVRFTVSDASGPLGTNTYPIRVASRAWAAAPSTGLVVVAEGCGGSLQTALRAGAGRVLTLEEATAAGTRADAVVLGPDAVSVTETQVVSCLKPGGRVLVLEQAAAARRFCPEIFASPPAVWGGAAGVRVTPGGMTNGALWATDRNLVFTRVPDAMRGATLLSTRMADKASRADAPLLRFQLPQGGRVWVAFDSRARELPAWLRSWERGAGTLDTSAPLALTVCSKAFPPGEVVLGGNGVAGAAAMYAVAVSTTGRVEKLQLASGGGGRVGADHEFEDFMFEKASGPGDATQTVNGEFVEMLGGDTARPGFEGLQPMDWKWWAQGEGRPAIVCRAAHRIDPTHAGVVPLGRFLDSHFYWSGNLGEVYRSKLLWPVFAVARPWGTLVVSELSLGAAAGVDPRADRTLHLLLARPIR